MPEAGIRGAEGDVKDLVGGSDERTDENVVSFFFPLKFGMFTV